MWNYFCGFVDFHNFFATDYDSVIAPRFIQNELHLGIAKNIPAKTLHPQSIPSNFEPNISDY